MSLNNQRAVGNRHYLRPVPSEREPSQQEERARLADSDLINAARSSTTSLGVRGGVSVVSEDTNVVPLSTGTKPQIGLMSAFGEIEVIHHQMQRNRELLMTAVRSAPTPSVSLASATKSVSAVAFGICTFSLLTYALTGLPIIHPFFASLAGAATVIFYGIGALMAKEDGRR
jgi:hypothetical protein